MANEIITFAGITIFFKEDLNIIAKGELKYKADFVLELRNHEFTSIILSMKSYSVHLNVDGDGGITEGQCECPRGNWICSHMAACAIYLNKKGMSKTELPNSWIAKPRKPARCDSKPFIDHFPSPKPVYRATSRHFSEDDRALLHARLSKLSAEGVQCPLQWITGPKPPEQIPNPLMPPLIEDLIEHFITDKTDIVNKVRVTAEQIAWLSNATIG